MITESYAATLSDAALDNAYAASYDARDNAAVSIYSREITSRHFRSIGAFFTFDFFATFFPKFNSRVSAASVSGMASVVVPTVVSSPVVAVQKTVVGTAKLAGETIGSTVAAAASPLSNYLMVGVAVAGIALYFVVKGR